MRSPSPDATGSILQAKLEDIQTTLAALNSLLGPLYQLMEAQAEAKSEPNERLEEVIWSLAKIAESLSISAKAMTDASGAIEAIAASQETQARGLAEIQSQVQDLMGWLGAPPLRAAAPTS